MSSLKKSFADEDQAKILAALNEMSEPATGKELARKTGIDEKIVNLKLKKMKVFGLIDSPVRCKYALTEAGQAQAGR
ncbi:MAG: transcriptional regulator [Firmicutes bacterium]|nr:transcriptional regulator [Bacillota bacterium]